MVEGAYFPMHNLILDKFLDLGTYRTGLLNVYLRPKLSESANDSKFRGESLASPFRPLLYSVTSSYLLELIYFTSTESNQPTKKTHKSINLREVMNLKHSDFAGTQKKTGADSRVYYGDIRQLGLFLAEKVKTANLFDTKEEEQEQEEAIFEGKF